MQFPIGFYDISLWLTTSVIILFATSELLSPYYGRTGALACPEIGFKWS
jgi:hypothetical protein